MVKVPPVERVVDKWLRKASAAGPDYEAGVQAPKEDWQKAALAAKDTYYAALDAIKANRTWEKGVAATPTDFWKKMCLEKGVRRYTEGIRVGQDKYAAKISKVLSILAGITLPPRGPKGDPRNYDRVRVIGDALHRAKIEGRI